MDQMNELFGSAVFEDSVQKVRLPDAIYKQLRKTKEEGTPLTREVCGRCCKRHEGLGG